MLRKIRIILAGLFFILVNLLFLDVSGVLHRYLAWVAKIQFLPALLAFNLGAVVAIVALTFVFGRLYCSIVCPLGVLQDMISWMAGRRRKYRFSYTAPRHWLRYGVFAVFVIAFVVGAGGVAFFIAPYSAYGRIATHLFSPFYAWGNNFLAWIAESMNSYAIHSTEVWFKGGIPLVVALLTLAAVAITAWRSGRLWCNTVCPVGTVLGVIARLSLFKPRIDLNKCSHCGLCARACKSACIDAQSGTVDASRCVACFDCLKNCRQGALRYEFIQFKNSRAASQTNAPESAKTTDAPDINHERALPVNESEMSSEAKVSQNTEQMCGDLANSGRRAFLAAAGLMALERAAQAQAIKVDGGLAPIEEKQAPPRQTPITPPGSQGAANLEKHCTSCQLCVAACPNQVLRPSKSIKSYLRPELSFERGYCRPECVTCATVCPTGAIQPIAAEQKAALQIGHAIWTKARCVVVRDGVNCDNCAAHCPVGAIHMGPLDATNPQSPQIPMIDTERCIGCGACEHLCPARPISAIHVEGHERHRMN